MKTDLTGSPDHAEIAGMVALLRGLSRHEHSDFSIGEQAAEIIECLAADAIRIDWLADPSNHMGQVQLPSACVEQNLHSLRAAIDAAMALASTEEPDA